MARSKNSNSTHHHQIDEQEDFRDTTHKERHQPSVSHSLKIKLDHLKTFEALTPNQQTFFDIYNSGGYFIGMFGSPGVGKAQPMDSKILTPDGWTRMGDISVGDTVVTPCGNVSTVVGVYDQGSRDIYEVVFHDGATARCCGEHLWDVWVRDKNDTKKSSKRTINTYDIIDLIDDNHSVSIDLITPFNVPDVELPIDPYVMGVLLGDGCIGPTVRITTADEFIVDEVGRLLDQQHHVNKIQSATYEYNIISNKSKGCNQYKIKLIELGLWGTRSNNKFIPPIYKSASPRQKLELIRGIMDTDGTTDRSNSRSSCSYSTASTQLALDVMDLARSIGATCSMSTRSTSYEYKGEHRSGQDSHTLVIGYRHPQDLFKLPRKKNLMPEKFGNGRIDHRRRIARVSVVSHEPARCIAVDHPSHLYVTDDYVITHNTFLSLYKALEEVLAKDNPFKQVVVVRSTVSVRDIGYLPGTEEEKIQIYEQPYIEICSTLFGRPDAWQRLKEQHHARFISTSFIRGISIDDAIIIVDESQNCTWAELSSVMGRVGHRSKIIFCGDKFQNDLVKHKNDQSGLSEFLNVCNSMDEFQTVYFTPDDIVRSSLVKSFIMACDKLGKLPG